MACRSREKSNRPAEGACSWAQPYAALECLERNGLVSSTIGAPTPERGGRAKRFFRVTARGMRAVKDTRQALVALWRDVPQLKDRRT